jgi:hypothetical protein
MGSNVSDRINEMLGLSKKMNLRDSTVRAIDKVAEGAAMDMAGQSGGVLLSKLANSFKNVFNWVKSKMPAVSDEAIMEKAQDVYKKLAVGTPESLLNEKETNAILNRLNVKTQPSIAQKTGSYEAAVFEQSVKSKTPEVGAAFRKRNAKVRQEALKSIEDMFRTGGFESDIIEGVSSRQAALKSAEKATTQKVEGALAKIKTSKTPQDVGADTLEKLSKDKLSAKASVTAEYAKIPEGVPINNIPIKKALAKIKKDFSIKGGGKKTYPKDIIKQISSKLRGKSKSPGSVSPLMGGKPKAATGGNLTLDNLRDWESQISQEIWESTSGINPNYKLARRLRMLKDGITESMDLLGKSEDKAVAEQYLKAKGKFIKYSKAFRKGTAGDVLRPGSQASGKKVALSDIPSRFFKTGKMDAADDLIRAVGDKKAASLIDDFAGMDMLSRAENNGKLSTKTAQTWLKRNANILRKYGLFDKYKDIVSTKELSDEAIIALREYEKGVASRILNADAGKVVESAMSKAGQTNTAAQMRDLLNMPGIKGNKAAVKGIKAEFKDFIIKKMETSGEDALGNTVHSVARAKTLLAKYMPAMKVLYKNEPQKIKAMKDYTRLLTILNRTKNVSASGGSTTIEKLLGTNNKEKTVSNIVQNATQLAAVKAGKGWFFSSMRNLAKAILSIPGKYSEKQITKFLTQAMLTGDARAIMDATRRYKGPYVEFNRAFNRHLMTLGAYTAKDAKKSISEAIEPTIQ